MEERLDERAEESAEQVLARLEAFVASRRARPSLLEPRDRRACDLAVATVDTVASPAAPVDTIIPLHDGMPTRSRRFVAEVAPALIAVSVCAFVILLSEWIAVGVAVTVAAALLVVGVVGLVRRVPLARAYTFGLVIAALLIRLS